jgi:hypothetical protein
MRIFFSLLSILVFSVPITAQNSTKYSEFSLVAGNMVYSGPFASAGGVGSWLQETGGRFGVALRKNYRPWFNIGVESNYGWVSLDDNNHGRPQRNIQVRTSVININVATEFMLVRYGKYHYANSFAPYFKLGAGANFFNPRVSDNHAALGDNTQVYNEAYASMNIFYGFGAKFRTSYSTSLAVEIVIHNAGTNQMGGVVVNSDTAPNDRYGGVMLSFSKMFF